MNTPIHQVGDFVLIRPEWDGDHTIHVIVEWNGDRGLIAPVHWPHGQVRPQELVTAAMIVPEHFSRPKIRKSRSTGPRQRKEKGNQRHA